MKRRGISSTKGVVSGLFGSSSSTKPALVRGWALRPLIGRSIPAVVSRPIFIRSRLFSPAAISSRRFLAATRASFWRVLSLFEIFDMQVSPYRVLPRGSSQSSRGKRSWGACLVKG
jgi:hypothetical protein